MIENVEQRLEKFNKYFNKFIVDDSTNISHTTMNGKGIFGRKYYIPDNKYDNFLKLYSDIIWKTELHIVERPLKVCQLIIDIDFELELDNKKREYTIDNIKKIIKIINDI